jgi:tetratricopeptide (TPR) repeat protein
VAEDLQQRAERRRGQEALTYYEAAATAFQEAITLADSCNAPFSRILDCRFGIAECLQSWAEGLLQVAAALPDAELTRRREHEVTSKAGFLLMQSVQTYQTVRELRPSPAPSTDTTNTTSSGNSSFPSTAETSNVVGAMRVDAAVNCANALSSWVKALNETATESDSNPISQSNTMMQLAEECCNQAIAREDDATTFSNLGDILIQHGELLCKAGSVSEGFSKFTKAREAYAKACELSSSEQGDDLPGLLLNWGAGVLTAAEHAETVEEALPLLDEAITRLRESITFDRGDPMPHNALGEALVAKAEWLSKADTPIYDLTAAHTAVQQALEEGYNGALRINATQTDAIVGVAEAQTQQAKIAHAAGNAALASMSWTAATAAYMKALATPEALGNLSERCNIRYNFACCLVKCGRLPEAVHLVSQLMAAGLVSAADVAQDPDLEPIRGMF